MGASDYWEIPTKRAVIWSEFLPKRGVFLMLYIRPGSQAQQLITLLSIVGEYPVRSLHLLGNERVYKARSIS